MRRGKEGERDRFRRPESTPGRHSLTHSLTDSLVVVAAAAAAVAVAVVVVVAAAAAAGAVAVRVGVGVGGGVEGGVGGVGVLSSCRSGASSRSRRSLEIGKPSLKNYCIVKGTTVLSASQKERKRGVELELEQEEQEPLLTNLLVLPVPGAAILFR